MKTIIWRMRKTQLHAVCQTRCSSIQKIPLLIKAEDGLFCLYVCITSFGFQLSCHLGFLPQDYPPSSCYKPACLCVSIIDVYLRCIFYDDAVAFPYPYQSHKMLSLFKADSPNELLSAELIFRFRQGVAVF